MPGINDKYRVRLGEQQRRELEAIVRQQNVGAAKARRARILLLSDSNSLEGRRSDRYISEVVGISERQVVRIRQQFVRERSDQPLDTACDRKPRPPAPERRKLDGEGEAQLVMLACSDPPEGRDRWTLQLLCDELKRLKVVESISPETVRQCLSKKRCSLGGPNGSASQAKIRPSS